MLRPSSSERGLLCTLPPECDRCAWGALQCGPCIASCPRLVSRVRVRVLTRCVCVYVRVRVRASEQHGASARAQ